ncbi:Cof-type HAD-IIB family hydrolase [Exercitatus varius]|uniref:Cof-type HAD-IIB family hydrolase n=1 Tax=Exercitatus varius TaxID=67857 RepID=A0AAW6QC56_9PAST|nr:Cof-type HAD-IIB family hydrolase [Exercitatus varius]MDG2950986.1 Cof-type HAD-IIB family hydrolase [Exercitatus varius]
MKKFPFRTFVSDMDGTLLNAHHVVGDFTRSTLKKLDERGIDIILATGRGYADVSSILNSMEIENAAMVTSNGAEVHDLKGNLIYSNYLPEELAFDIMQESFNPKNVCLNSYQGDEWFINVDLPALMKYHKESGFSYQVVDFAAHHGRRTQKVFFIGRSLEDLLPLEKQLREKYGEYTSIMYSTPQCLEVMNKNVSKATALSALVEQRDYDLKDCIAFGDGMNDIEMLTEVGKGCVMGNADARMVEKVPHLERIGFNKDEAVASYARAVFGIY